MQRKEKNDVFEIVCRSIVESIKYIHENLFCEVDFHETFLGRKAITLDKLPPTHQKTSSLQANLELVGIHVLLRIPLHDHTYHHQCLLKRRATLHS